MQDFLSDAGWGHATLTPITPDWSPRHYTRVTRDNGDTAIFLQGPLQDFRGHGLKDFVDIGTHYKKLGLSVPDIYAQDLKNARLLMEDFGDTSIDAPDIEVHAYEMAVDVLAALRRDQQLHTTLTRYEDGYIFQKIPLFATHYAKTDAGDWMQAWQSVTAPLPACPHGLAHMDYKAGNLFWLPRRTGIQRIGILDYQAAQSAPFVYDLVTLLEDARRSLKPQLKDHLKKRFTDALPAALKPLFDIWYPVIAVQFHTGVLGQITGRDHVAPDVAPRLETYLRSELQNPSLKPLRDWCTAHGCLT